jgi:hypothetical protein
MVIYQVNTSDKRTDWIKAKLLFFWPLELRASVPVVIAPVAPEDDANILPTYENAWRSMPYDPLLAEQLHTLREIPRHVPSRSNSTDSSSTSSSSSIEDLLETMPWMGFDISRVPSYGTAMRTVDIPHQFNSTLPTYDSLVMA